MDRPVLHDWLAWTMSASVQRVRDAAARLGDPVFGLRGPLESKGVLNGHGPPSHPYISLSYRGPNNAYVDVTTARHTLGGTHQLVHDLLQTAAAQAKLPFSISIDERLVMVPVLDGRAQFRVLEASDGQWIAAGGHGKRHLRLRGSAGTSPDAVELTTVELP